MKVAQHFSAGVSANYERRAPSGTIESVLFTEMRAPNRQSWVIEP
jgi:hypothetical protein